MGWRRFQIASLATFWFLRSFCHNSAVFCIPQFGETFFSMQVTIWHNTACATSRNTLAIIRATGIEPAIVEYVQHPPDRTTLLRLMAVAQLTPRALLRVKDTPFHELGLGDPSLHDELLIDAMLVNPILINRPLVETPLGVRLCRPSEVVLEILPNPLPHDFVKEDGDVVRA